MIARNRSFIWLVPVSECTSVCFVVSFYQPGGTRMGNLGPKEVHLK